MAYMVLETSVRTHRKFLSAGPEACWLWVCGLGYCKEGLTDGFIPDSAVEYLGVKRARRLAQRLVSVRLWEAVSGGWRMHDYLQHNKPADEIREIMRKRKEGGKLGGRPPKTSEDNLQGVGEVLEEVNLPENPIHHSTTGTPDNTPEEESSAADDGAEPSVLVFPTVGPGGSAWGLSEAQIAEWVDLFPTVDVTIEARKALAWVKANPGRRKTVRGMPKFLVNWLSRSTNSQRGGPAERPYSEREIQEYQQWVRAMGGCGHRPECESRQECMAKWIKRRRGEAA